MSLICQVLVQSPGPAKTGMVIKIIVRYNEEVFRGETFGWVNWLLQAQKQGPPTHTRRTNKPLSRTGITPWFLYPPPSRQPLQQRAFSSLVCFLSPNTAETNQHFLDRGKTNQLLLYYCHCLPCHSFHNLRFACDKWNAVIVGCNPVWVVW